MTVSLDIDTSFTESDELDGNSGARLVRGLRLGDSQTEGPLTVFPVFSDGDDGSSGDEDAGSRYVTLHRALGEGSAVITELNEGGSIPELRVANRGDAAILMLDGEELRGAKQNRVLASTILVERRTTLVVPVSCTEQGRWAYASPSSPRARSWPSGSVRYAMRSSTHAAMLRGAPVPSRPGAPCGRRSRECTSRHGDAFATSAMRDAYVAKKRHLDRLLAAFPLMEGQRGLLVLHGSRVVGLDFVSRATAVSRNSTTSCCAAMRSRRWYAAASPATDRRPRPSSSGSPGSWPALQEPRPRLGRALRGRRRAGIDARASGARRARRVLRCGWRRRPC